MPEKPSQQQQQQQQSIHLTASSRTVEEASRVLPLAVATLVCFLAAVTLGYGSWYLFGSHRFQKNAGDFEYTVTNIDPNPNAAPKNESIETAPAPAANQQTTAPNPAVETNAGEAAKPENVVAVAGGEITLGGGDTGRPLKRALVEDFFIAETEVTNAQYAEFVKATNHRAPAGWKNNEFPEGAGDFPVTGVSFSDAEAFCKWLETKINLPVRLPTEAEWELAARGRENNKYPWGGDWDAKAAASSETGGKVSAVKSFSLNRSPFGAYDMAGNVWEWTQDKVSESDVAASDEQVLAALKSGKVLRVVKGGSATEKAAQISARARFEIPEQTRVATVGFRYLVGRKKQ
ncbi:MAG: formylglycine-generating enzyme family protein [Acidobacteriota bacterium]|nr:formylglycine-generating enzyme family protein [Acidobacteriota bacterium]